MLCIAAILLDTHFATSATYFCLPMYTSNLQLQHSASGHQWTTRESQEMSDSQNTHCTGSKTDRLTSQRAGVPFVDIEPPAHSITIYHMVEWPTSAQLSYDRTIAPFQPKLQQMTTHRLTGHTATLHYSRYKTNIDTTATIRLQLLIRKQVTTH